MGDKDNFDVEDKDSQKPEPATRARNRTVMLTPDITGQVRAKLGQAGTQVAASFGMKEQDVAATIAPQSVPPGRGFYSQVVQPTIVAEPPKALYQTPVAPQAIVASEPSRLPEAGKPQGPTGEYSTGPSLIDCAMWATKGPILGFLVSYDKDALGEICTLRTGRMIVTSAPQASGNYLLIQDESVSPLHAIMRVTQSGEIQILDQLSESGTFIRRFGADEEIELSGEKSFLEHGDVVRFGNRSFHVTLVVKSDQEG